MANNELRRILGRGFSAAVCIGLIIGLGILRTPGEIAATVNDPVLYMALWIGGGIFVLLSTVVVSELIALTPRSGGMYSLVARAFGQFPSFLGGWMDWVAGCAGLALKGVVLVEYLALLDPSIATIQKPLVLVITSVFAALQLFGTRLSAGVQQAASAGIGLIIVGLTVALSFAAVVKGAPGFGVAAENQLASSAITAYGLVVAAIVFTYDGWYAGSYFSGEVKSGGRGVAVGSLQGVVIVIVLYIALNFALVASVPLLALVGEDLALAKAMELSFGANASLFIVAAAVFILLSHHNLQYMMSARILHALSTDGFGSERAAMVADNGTPKGAVVLTWLLTCTLILIGSFEILLTMSVTLYVLMYVALVLGVFRLRRTEPDTVRPFVAWGFPYTGLVCAIGWSLIALFVAFTSLESTLYGSLLVLIAFPVFLLIKRARHLDQVK